MKVNSMQQLCIEKKHLSPSDLHCYMKKTSDKSALMSLSLTNTVQKRGSTYGGIIHTFWELRLICPIFGLLAGGGDAPNDTFQSNHLVFCSGLDEEQLCRSHSRKGSKDQRNKLKELPMLGPLKHCVLV